MKKGIHPQYYPQAKIKCACGAEYEIGSTKPYMEVEVCAKCHPFYTGKEKFIDKMGQIQKYKERLKKAKK
ncbi:50S ribosomal protein L31 [Candidatus Parcubacteria bacterium]|nr:50S ribosomal protein L31 [Candidatus Parcubacteria bacterium]